ncbi:MAG TPA: LytTR family DNA-binding domain-containing protein [Chitinophagaceae bacterium]|nr:LytTR family DNA-binding domain-containing protein [Chitinophagaceae bacterium]
MIKCIIIEDERLAQDVIKNHLQRSGRFNLVGTYRNAPEAKEALEKETVDLIFLDIQLPGMTGLNFLRSLSNPPLVVFTTSYPEYALESYEFNVIDYLLKPDSCERFSKTIDKIIDGKIFKTPDCEIKPVYRDHIFIRSDGKFFTIRFSEIIYIEGMKDYLKIHTPEHVIVTHQTMGDMENILPINQFIRVHKSYIVAIAHIKAVFGNSVDMTKAQLPIGLNYKERIMSFVTGKSFGSY